MHIQASIAQTRLQQRPSEKNASQRVFNIGDGANGSSGRHHRHNEKKEEQSYEVEKEQSRSEEGRFQNFWKGIRHGVESSNKVSAQYSVLDGTKATKIDVRQMKLRWIFHPDYPFKITWEIFLSILVFYSVIIIPYHIGFQVPLTSEEDAINIFITVCFGMDILVNFNTAILDEQKERLIYRRRVIAKKYLHFWFWIDLIATIPFDLVLSAVLVGRNSISLVRLARILRLVRLVKLYRIFRGGNALTSFLHPGLVSMSTLLLQLFLLAHIFACFWHYLAISDLAKDYPTNWIDYGQFTNQSSAERYVASYYYTIVTMLTIGYGDIHGTNQPERIYAIVMMLIGGIIFGALTNQVTYLLAKRNPQAQAFKENMNDFKTFLASSELPVLLQRRAKTAFAYYLTQKSVFGESDILDQLPPLLVTNLVKEIYHHDIEAIDLFSRFVEKYPLFVIHLVRNSRPFEVFPGQAILTEGDICNDLFFIKKGMVYFEPFQAPKKPRRQIRKRPLTRLRRLTSQFAATWTRAMVGNSPNSTDNNNNNNGHHHNSSRGDGGEPHGEEEENDWIDMNDEQDEDSLDNDEDDNSEDFSMPEHGTFRNVSGFISQRHYFGDLEMIKNTTSLATYRAANHCHLLAISHRVLKEAMSEHEEVFQYFDDEVKKRMSTFFTVLHVHKRGLKHLRNTNTTTNNKGNTITAINGENVVIPPAVHVRSGRRGGFLRSASISLGFTRTANTILDDLDVRKQYWKDGEIVHWKDVPHLNLLSHHHGGGGGESSLLNNSNRYKNIRVIDDEEIDHNNNSSKRNNHHQIQRNATRRYDDQIVISTPAKQRPYAILQQRLLIDPTSRNKLIWDFFIALLILYSVLIIPVELGFNDNAFTGSDTVDLIISGFFFIDILISFSTAYFSEKADALVISRKRIVRHYLKTWFMIDLISTLPFDRIFNAILDTSTNLTGTKLLKVIRLIRLFKISRVLKFSSYLEILEEKLGFSPAFFQLVLLLFQVFFIAHLIACLWYGLAASFPTPTYPDQRWYENQEMFTGKLVNTHIVSRYLVSIYYAFTTITTVGYGDIHPCSVYERGFAIFAVLVGASIFAYTLANVSAALNSVSGVNAKSKEKLVEVLEYLKEKGCSAGLTNKVFSHMKRKYDDENAFNLSIVTRCLPPNITTEVFYHLYNRRIQAIPIFRYLHKQSVVVYLFHYLQPVFYEENEYIVRKDNPVESIIFLVSGSAQVFREKTNLRIPSSIHSSEKHHGGGGGVGPGSNNNGSGKMSSNSSSIPVVKNSLGIGETFHSRDDVHVSVRRFLSTTPGGTFRRSNSLPIPVPPAPPAVPSPSSPQLSRRGKQKSVGAEDHLRGIHGIHGPSSTTLLSSTTMGGGSGSGSGGNNDGNPTPDISLKKRRSSSTFFLGGIKSDDDKLFEQSDIPFHLMTDNDYEKINLELLATIGTGDFIGHADFMYSRSSYRYYAKTTSPCTVYILTKVEMNRLMRLDPIIAYQLQTALVRAIRRQSDLFSKKLRRKMRGNFISKEIRGAHVDGMNSSSKSHYGGGGGGGGGGQQQEGRFPATPVTPVTPVTPPQPITTTTVMNENGESVVVAGSRSSTPSVVNNNNNNNSNNSIIPIPMSIPITPPSSRRYGILLSSMTSRASSMFTSDATTATILFNSPFYLRQVI
eukprot:gene3102-3396_t